MITAVNFHLWEPCNMRCNFCFATFQDVKQSILPKGHLPKEQAIEVVKQLAAAGFEKITFAGGEPTLCPWLPELIKTAKEAGLTTMIVTNGSRLSEDFLKKNKPLLDWIALSVDSLNPETNIETGRAITGTRPFSKYQYFEIVGRIKKHGYGLKINTVVSTKNYAEDLSELILHAKPKRWKIFQVLPIKGQNDEKINDFKITEDQFSTFLKKNKKVDSITKIVAESNDDMRGSYAMVDPAGRFYDNTGAEYNYSSPILGTGVKSALQEVNYAFEKFIGREGLYDWSRISDSQSQ